MVSIGDRELSANDLSRCVRTSPAAMVMVPRVSSICARAGDAGPPSQHFTELPRIYHVRQSYRIGNLHGVTICRELGHSDQINKSEHGGTDRRLFHETTPAGGVALVKVLRPSLRWRQWRSVIICRELRHSDQINKSEHGGTDRRLFHETTPAGGVARDTPRPVQHGGGSFLKRVGKRDGKMPTGDRIASAGKCPVPSESCTPFLIQK